MLFCSICLWLTCLTFCSYSLHQCFISVCCCWRLWKRDETLEHKNVERAKYSCFHHWQAGSISTASWWYHYLTKFGKVETIPSALASLHVMPEPHLPCVGHSFPLGQSRIFAYLASFLWLFCTARFSSLAAHLTMHCFISDKCIYLALARRLCKTACGWINYRCVRTS